MNWLILLFFIELGYSPFYNVENNSSYVNQNIYYVNMDVELVLIDHLFIGGSFKTYFTDRVDGNLLPFELNYLFKAGFKYENVEVGFRHQCNYPVLLNGVQSQGKSYSGFEEFYIRISN